MRVFRVYPLQKDYVIADNVIKESIKSSNKKILEKIGNYTMLVDDHTISINPSANTTITLPALSEVYNDSNFIGIIYYIKRLATDASSYTVTIDASGAELIDGELTQTLLAGESLTLQANKNNWEIL